MPVKKYTTILANIFVFLLPWQTLWIYHEPFMNGIKWEYGVLGFFVTELLAWVIIILFLYQYGRIIKTNMYLIDKKIGKDRLFIASCLVLIIYLFLSSLWSPVPELARQQSLRITLSYLLFILFSSQYISFARVRFWFIMGSIAPSLLAIWQFLSQSTVASSLFGLAKHIASEAGTSVVVLDNERWLRAYGPMTHPNMFGGYLVIVLWFIFLHYFSVKKNAVQEKYAEVLLMGVSVIASTALVFTFSRSAWVSFIILMCGTMYWYKKSNLDIRLHGLLIVFTVVFALIFSPITKTRITIGSEQEKQTIHERVQSVVGGKDIFLTSPWIGSGVGNYTARMYQLRPTLPGWEYQPAHAVPLLLAGEVGVLGMGLFGLCIGLYFLLFWSFFQKQKWYVIGTGIALVFPLLFLDHYLYTSYTGLILLVLLFTSFVQTTE